MQKRTSGHDAPRTGDCDDHRTTDHAGLHHDAWPGARTAHAVTPGWAAGLDKIGQHEEDVAPFRSERGV